MVRLRIISLDDSSDQTCRARTEYCLRSGHRVEVNSLLQVVLLY